LSIGGTSCVLTSEYSTEHASLCGNIWNTKKRITKTTVRFVNILSILIIFYTSQENYENPVELIDLFLFTLSLYIISHSGYISNKRLRLPGRQGGDKMPVSDNVISDQIKELKDFRNWQNRPEISFLPKIVDEGEKISAITVGLYIESKWLLTLTDRRIILIHRKFLEALSDEILLKDICSLTLKKGLLFSRMDFLTKDDRELTIESIMKKDADKIMEIIISEWPDIKIS